MLKVDDYRLITNASPEAFEKEIKEALSEGWHLYGYPFSRSFKQDDVGQFCQALIKSKAGDKEVSVMSEDEPYGD